MKLTVVMTYRDRQEQLNRTLESIAQSKSRDFRVIIVDDRSEKKITISGYPFPIDILRLEGGMNNQKQWNNPCVAYNLGFYFALLPLNKPDVIIIQNAECYHEGDILSHAKGILKDEYWTYHCYSLGEGENTGVRPNNRGASFDGDSAWYNHELYRPVGYHFCSAIRTENLIKINGFDERFLEGPGWDDNYFVHQVNTLGLKVKFIDYPFVYHQWHYTSDWKDKPNNNKAVYEKLIKDNNYRAEHIITRDL
jgi:glycosyltransferase involved in cell wall biosynthesis